MPHTTNLSFPVTVKQTAWSPPSHPSRVHPGPSVPKRYPSFTRRITSSIHLRIQAIAVCEAG